MPKLEPPAADELSLLPTSILAAIDAAAIPGLSDQPKDAGLAAAITHCDDLAWRKLPPSNRSMCESGLWLLAGDLDRSHQISQENHSVLGSFWHGIMHRREGDFGNSKYWFAKVGNHEVSQRINQWSDGQYGDPIGFVDTVRRAVEAGGDAQQQCELVQWIEWQALMVCSIRG